MRRIASNVVVIVATIVLAPAAYTQQTTERYIPVGKSPGISGKYSYIGQIEQVDPQNRTITVSGPEGRRTIRLTETTKIWLDRTGLRMSNQTGSAAECQPGRRVEVHYVDHETNGEAAWIKIVAPES